MLTPFLLCSFASDQNFIWGSKAWLAFMSIFNIKITIGEKITQVVPIAVCRSSGVLALETSEGSKGPLIRTYKTFRDARRSTASRAHVSGTPSFFCSQHAMNP